MMRRELLQMIPMNDYEVVTLLKRKIRVYVVLYWTRTVRGKVLLTKTKTSFRPIVVDITVQKKNLCNLHCAGNDIGEQLKEYLAEKYQVIMSINDMGLMRIGTQEVVYVSVYESSQANRKSELNLEHEKWYELLDVAKVVLENEENPFILWTIWNCLKMEEFRPSFFMPDFGKLRDDIEKKISAIVMKRDFVGQHRMYITHNFTEEKLSPLIRDHYDRFEYSWKDLAAKNSFLKAENFIPVFEENSFEDLLIGDTIVSYDDGKIIVWVILALCFFKTNGVKPASEDCND